MPITLPPLVELLPWLYALALIPASLLHTRERFWWPARGAGYVGLSLVLAAWLQAALNEQKDDRLGLAMAGLVSLLALVIIDYSRRYLEGEPGQRRYVLALLGTLAAVATVVTSTNLLVLVGAWIFPPAGPGSGAQEIPRQSPGRCLFVAGHRVAGACRR